METSFFIVNLSSDLCLSHVIKSLAVYCVEIIVIDMTTKVEAYTRVLLWSLMPK